MVDPKHPWLGIVRQCALVSISRSSFYYEGKGESPLNLALMRLIDAQFLETPWYGSRQMARHLRRLGYTVGRKRVRRLMRLMGLSAIYQKPRTSDPHPDHRIYPYLLSYAYAETVDGDVGFDPAAAVQHVGVHQPRCPRRGCRFRPELIRQASGPGTGDLALGDIAWVEMGIRDCRRIDLPNFGQDRPPLGRGCPPG